MTAVELPPALALRKSETHSFTLAAEEGAEVHAATGRFWITLEGDREDYVVSAGETMLLEGPGLVVLEGLLPANRFALHRLHFS
jgi:hypothetical protein